MKYELAPSARHDLEDIGAFVSEAYPSVAPVMETELRRLFELISVWPLIGRAGPRPGTRIMPVRRYPYVIIWRYQDGVVEIVRILHTSQDQGREFGTVR